MLQKEQHEKHLRNQATELWMFLVTNVMGQETIAKLPINQHLQGSGEEHKGGLLHKAKVLGQSNIES